VLRMGLKRQHVGLTVLVCILCEALLISVGVAGVGTMVESSPLLLSLARWGGALFLAWYGLRAWRSAFGRHALNAAPNAEIGLREALLTVLAATLLNPHVYLDTVVLLGAIGGQQGQEGKWWFALGAMSAGAAWFVLLGFGARILAPWFAKPAAWRLLDAVIGVVMLSLAVSLLVN
jgi:L-lysine exporter family protein LysE/ArgO